MAAAGEADRKNLIQVVPPYVCVALDYVIAACSCCPCALNTVCRQFVQVAATRPVAFYASLAKKLLLDNATVELSAIGKYRVFMCWKSPHAPCMIFFVCFRASIAVDLMRLFFLLRRPGHEQRCQRRRNSLFLWVSVDVQLCARVRRLVHYYIFPLPFAHASSL